jgi:hypothetical protein
MTIEQAIDDEHTAKQRRYLKRMLFIALCIVAALLTIHLVTRQYYRRYSVYREIKAKGGSVLTTQDSPDWLRRLVG